MSERFERLAIEHRPALLGHALRLTHRRDAAEDLVQAALIRAMAAFDRFDGENFRAWVSTIVTNLHLNERKRRVQHHTQSLDDGDERVCPEPSPHDRMDEHTLAPEIWAAIDEMPVRLARAFLLAEVVGMSHHEIAAAEGIPSGTVQSRTFRARAHLRERLADYARRHHGVR